MWNIFILFTITTIGATYAIHTNSSHDNAVGGNCNTWGDEWKCCETSPKIDNFQLNVCITLKLLRKNVGLEMTLTCNGHTIFDKEISGRNPPGICTDVPYLDEIVEICLKFHNLDWQKETLSGCVKLEFELVHLKSYDFEIGCFKFPLSMDELSKIEKGFLKALHENINLIQIID